MGTTGRTNVTVHNGFIVDTAAVPSKLQVEMLAVGEGCGDDARFGEFTR